MEEVFAAMLSASILIIMFGGLMFLLLQIVRSKLYMHRLKKVDLSNVTVFATKNGRPTILQDIKNKNKLIKL